MFCFVALKALRRHGAAIGPTRIVSHYSVASSDGREFTEPEQNGKYHTLSKSAIIIIEVFVDVALIPDFVRSPCEQKTHGSV